MVGVISLAILVGAASLLGVAVLLMLPAALLSRFLRGIQTRSPMIVREAAREPSQGSRLVTRSSL